MLGPCLCVKKNSEYPPGVLRKLFELKANMPSVQTSAEGNETKIYVTEVFKILENILQVYILNMKYIHTYMVSEKKGYSIS